MSAEEAARVMCWEAVFAPRRDVNANHGEVFEDRFGVALEVT